MSNTAIKVENLGKLYRLGEVGTGTLSHDLNRWWAGLRGKGDPFAKIGQTNDRTVKGVSDYVWALKDVNFEVKQGEVLGIIGRNGAGKSTLLKLLSKVTAPSTGRMMVNGRIASLLEVGTGFHPEMTGRENIFLNGAILGMTKKEIRSKFDEIVDFAGVERYIDTPVKRYSSGMYVRLAFAVAAFLEPEILIVDEVLAVGDAEFQKKCLGRMKDVSLNDGRTVLFVSHNMGAIERLTNQVLVLKHGQVAFHTADVTKGIEKYLDTTEQHQFVWDVSNADIDPNEFVNPISIYLSNAQGEKIRSSVRNDEQINLVIEAEFLKLDPALNVGFAIYDKGENLLYWSLNTDTEQNNWPELTEGKNTLSCSLPQNLLNEGTYSIHLIVSLHFIRWIYEPCKNAPCISYEINGGLSKSPYWLSARPGMLAPILQFKKI